MIETEAQLDAWFDDVRDLFLRATEKGMERAVLRTAESIRQVMPVETGNARDAIGVPGPIASSPSHISGLRGKRDFGVRRSGDTVEATLWLTGMAYFGALDRRYDIKRGPVSRAAREVVIGFGEAFERGEV